MVFINLTWQSTSFFSASLFLSAFFLGGIIQPWFKDTNGRELCLVCPGAKGENMFFQNGATFVYHIICFLHFGGMASGLLGLVLSIFAINSSENDAANYLKQCLAIGLPIAWVLAWAIQLIVLATAQDTKWLAYNPKETSNTVWVWWIIFAVLNAAVVALVLASAYGLMKESYEQVPKA